MKLYIDPGTGSMLFSIIIGLATTSVFLFRGLWIKMKYKLHGGQAKADVDKIPYVLFSDHKRYWNVFKPVCDEFEKRQIDCEYWTMSEDDPALLEHYEHVKCQFIGEGNKAFAKLNMMNAGICLATTPGLDVLQWKRSKNVDHYVHLYHAIDDGTVYRMFGVDCYDAVLLVGELQREPREALNEMRHLQEQEIVTTGSTYMDALLARKEALEDGETASSDAIKSEMTKTILCAPSWGESGILSRYGEKFIQAMIDTGYNVIIRPHPQSLTAEKELIDTLREKYPDSEKFSWNFDNDNFDVLRRSDILISDFSGVIFDYALVFDRPVIVADTAFDASPYDAAWFDRLPLNFALIDELGIRLEEKDFDHLKETIDTLLTDDRYAEGRAQAKEKAWAHIGEAAPRTVDYLVGKHKKLSESILVNQPDDDIKERISA